MAASCVGIDFSFSKIESSKGHVETPARQHDLEVTNDRRDVVQVVSRALIKNKMHFLMPSAAPKEVEKAISPEQTATPERLVLVAA